MTDPSKDPSGDPFHLLRAHVRAVALLEQPRRDADELVADITGSVDRTDRSRSAQVLPIHGAGSPRRRRWLLAASAAAVVAVGGAGVAAFVSSRPADPVAGIVCRESGDFGSTSVVLPIDDDPVAACANLWKTGDLPTLGGGAGSGAVPDLVACTGGAGAVEVLPVAAGQSCETFGLVPAEPSTAADPVLQLDARVVLGNGAGCRPADELVESARRMLADLEMSEWTVVVDPTAGDCALLAIDANRRHLIVRADLLRTPPQEETP